MSKYLIYCCNGDGGDWAPPTNKPLNSDKENADKNKTGSK